MGTRITTKNYNAAGKTAFENSPAKVWHLNDLTGTTIGYKSIAGFINFTASNTETITVLSNDTGYPDVNLTVNRLSGARSQLYLAFDIPGNTARYSSCIAYLNKDDSANTSVNIMSVAESGTSAITNLVYNFTIQQITTGTPALLAYGGAQPKIIYFEIKLFI